MRTVQLVGSTPLTRVALGWFLEQGRALDARVVAVDPGAEDEQAPWFAPLRGWCADLGVRIGRQDADLTLDLDPDGRRMDGPGVRIVGPGGVQPDLNRALLQPGGAWWAVYGDGARIYAQEPLQVLPDDDAALLRARATLRGVEALAAGWGREAESDAPHPPLDPARFRAQERQLLWPRPAVAVLARIRAAAGPWGGARAHVGDTPVAIEAAEPAERPDGDFLPGTIAAVDHGVVVACGTGAVRLLRIRPSWRPERAAAEYAAEVGAGVGYLLT